jgi:hypothetical protein
MDKILKEIELLVLLNLVHNLQCDCQSTLSFNAGNSRSGSIPDVLYEGGNFAA